jgi:arginine-tRNA-protein transferase
METLFRFIAPPGRCGYLPDRMWSLEYEMVADVTPAAYMERMLAGWRRFGSTLFRPHCRTCTACRALRVCVDRFRPSRTQRRAHKANEARVTLVIGKPSVTRAKLLLYDRYHAFQTETKGWPVHPAGDGAAYAASFVDNPFPTQEWCYYVGDRLVGVGYVDDLPGCLSAIYYFYDPADRHRSLGTWNVLNLLRESAIRAFPYLYLGYYVAGCASMVYKSHYVPNQLLDVDGRWHDFCP